MQRGTFFGAAAATLLIAGAATAQVTEQNIHGGRTGDLAALCGAGEQDVSRPVALAYCQGFFVAAGQYHQATTAQGASQRPIFCLPTPSPTFEQARSSFVAWARANPQYAGDRAIDGLMHFAADAYPCPGGRQARPGR